MQGTILSNGFSGNETSVSLKMSVERNDVYQAMWWLEHQRIFFFGAFIVGSILILTFKSFGINNGIISVLAVMLMLIYAGTGIRNKLKVRLDVLGDNLYYLGFLYTLVSLSYSLYTLGKGTADIKYLENLFIIMTICWACLKSLFQPTQGRYHRIESTIAWSLTEASNLLPKPKIGTDISTLRTVLSRCSRNSRSSASFESSIDRGSE
jgi:hypothetical protein